MKALREKLYGGLWTQTP
uniref:Uncharacterized protein n=1 Tax=Anguilla anguilla TaxID=7936 RepID=A0A0E9VEV0_ANGAN